ncbi:hypothetical protein AXG93_702s1070 [Marchantia polymorpha subsp. ruderalis]|uniref:Uncharacterized protein n=1 Tax=Marchantia polymorpha subsp. ruderalis TaxID=1480154 RepID=A0A176W962_MARPO|nr:hypothetical protein AXG93_702s1070 [Marchantia polymorpha subsp. ruderalis]
MILDFKRISLGSELTRRELALVLAGRDGRTQKTRAKRGTWYFGANPIRSDFNKLYLFSRCDTDTPRDAALREEDVDHELREFMAKLDTDSRELVWPLQLVNAMMEFGVGHASSAAKAAGLLTVGAEGLRGDGNGGFDNDLTDSISYSMGN